MINKPQRSHEIGVDLVDFFSDYKYFYPPRIFFSRLPSSFSHISKYRRRSWAPNWRRASALATWSPLTEAALLLDAPFETVLSSVDCLTKGNFTSALSRPMTAIV
ncbi:hypothetical protein RJ55_06148 [Drechmeria coniospora]|nr:hypothetical protein RJ55_06148 [Drechmeria coniospora]